jgi:hypothetical protein
LGKGLASQYILSSILVILWENLAVLSWRTRRLLGILLSLKIYDSFSLSDW